MGENEGEILRAACLTLKDMADTLRVPATTVRNWSVGRVEIPAESRAALAVVFRARAARLEEWASELEGASGET